MTRFEFLETLKQALTGLPPDLIAKTVAEYERRIFEASAAGQSEDEIMAGLGEPQKIADDLRASLAPKVPAVVPSPAQSSVPAATPAPTGPLNVFRVFFSFIGLMLFNLFMVIPVTVYAALLFAAFITSLAFFGGGIVLTAGGISGVNQIVLDEPFRHIRIVRPHAEIGAHASVTTSDEHTVVNIGENGVHVETNGDAHPAAAASASKDAASAKAVAGSAAVAASAASAAPASSTKAAASASTPADNAKTTHEHTVVDIGPQGVTVVSKDAEGNEHGKRFLRDGKDGQDDDNVNIDMPGLHIHDGDLDADESVISLGGDFISASRPVQIGVGIGITLAGIIGFLLCLVVSRYTLLGLYRLAQMELAVLRGA
jgi:uncharacterized membrane protein